MKNSLGLLAFGILLSMITSANSFEYPWLTLRGEILKNHKLGNLEFAPITTNLKNYAKKDEFKNFSFYVVDTMQTEDYCGDGFYKVYGFYKDSLFFILMGTHEMPYVKKDPKDTCISKLILNGAKLDQWYIIMKEHAHDGNIFEEGGYLGHNTGKDTYSDKLISVGLLSRPLHLQYFYIFTSKQFLDNFTSKRVKSNKFVKDSPSNLFVRSLCK